LERQKRIKGSHIGDNISSKRLVTTEGYSIRMNITNRLQVGAHQNKTEIQALFMLEGRQRSTRDTDLRLKQKHRMFPRNLFGNAYSAPRRFGILPRRFRIMPRCSNECSQGQHHNKG